MSVIKLTQDMYESTVEKADKPVLIDFFATWCGPCKMVSPIVDEIADERSDVVVCKVDVDEQPELAQKFDIMSIPTLVVMKDGKMKSNVVGLVSKSEIIAMIEK